MEQRELQRAARSKQQQQKFQVLIALGTSFVPFRLPSQPPCPPPPPHDLVRARIPAASGVLDAQTGVRNYVWIVAMTAPEDAKQNKWDNGEKDHGQKIGGFGSQL
ncbi:hypothetical protein OUZ56_008304 [Daphnia magna]|uniref:Uncharacterized protein n=1 Tax=Daphnia magna TaxID=35525 RepID=A0ABR0ACK0_9CRUS|nr:hypothetical protein OUZ56_008304 [Daphnia magna]